MKIVPKILAVVMTVNLVSPKPVKAVPVVIVPLVCAKVCVLIGTAIVGGATAYIWQHRTTKKKYLADVQGNVRRMIDDPEEFEKEQIIDIIKAKSPEAARKKCKYLAEKKGLVYVDYRYKGNDRYECIAK